MKIYNVHLTNLNNVGDNSVSPLDYYAFPYETEALNVTAFENPEQFRGQTVIWGGGGLIHLPHPEYCNGRMEYLEVFDTLPTRHLIGWGVGHNVHNENIYDITYQDSFKKFDLLGIRDNFDNGFEYLPCVSCKYKKFHHRYKAKHDTVLFEHAGGFDIIKQLDDTLQAIPKMSARGTKIEDIIPFLASGKTVITNSYHGAYWAMLLNRKVVVYRPFSTKFAYLHKGISFCGSTKYGFDIQTAIAKARSDKGFLKKCRSINDNFYNRVLDLIK